MGVTTTAYWYLSCRLESDFQLELKLSPHTKRDSLKLSSNINHFLIKVNSKLKIIYNFPNLRYFRRMQGHHLMPVLLLVQLRYLRLH